MSRVLEVAAEWHALRDQREAKQLEVNRVKRELSALKRAADAKGEELCQEQMKEHREATGLRERPL